MTIDNAFNDPNSPRGRVLDWITHRSGWFLTGYAGLCVATWFTNSHWLVVPATVAVFALCTAVSVTLLHDQFTRICIGCMREVPENASDQAHRHRWRLKVWHIWTGLRALLIVAALLAVSVVVGSRIPGPHSGLAQAPLQLWVIAAVGSERFHHRLRPWCSYCKDWGEDGGIREPSPDPMGHNALTG